jgi:hypothetical protein
VVLAGALAAVVVTLNAEGCSSDSPHDGLGDGKAGHGGGTMGRGGVGGSISGGGGSAGMATGGAGGQAGCQVPTGTPGTWEEIAPPSGQTNFHVTDSFALGPDDLYFAGSVGDPLTGANITEAHVLRWTRGCWSAELTIPRATAPIDFPSVHGLGPDDVWATASDVIYHRDARGWTRFANEGWRTMVRPPGLGGPVELNRVRAVASNDVWFAATNNILHWDGQTWTTYNFGSPNYPNESGSIEFFFHTIWIDSPTSIWVGGGSDEIGNTMDLSFMHHFDGASWTHTAITLGQVEAIWRVGSALWLANPAPMFTIQRFDGTASMNTPIAGMDPNDPPGMTSLFGRTATDLWAAGDSVARFDGQSWAFVPGVPAAAITPNQEHNTYVAGDAASVWLATTGPRFFRMVVGP